MAASICRRFSGELHAFRFENGRGEKEQSVAPSPGGEPFLAGIAVHPGTGKLYVCNEAEPEVWVVDPATLKREAVITVGPHP